MPRLIGPNGATVVVSEEKAARLGWEPAEKPKAAPKKAAAKSGSK